MTKMILGFIVLLLIVSCKKETNNSNISIYGKWHTIKIKGTFWNVGGIVESDSVLFGSKAYADFRADGKIYSYNDINYSGPVLHVSERNDTVNFVLSGNDTLITTDNKGNRNTFLLQDFTANTLTLYATGGIGFGSYESWAFYSR